MPEPVNVPCPVCHGVGHTPASPKGCLCCGSKGTITRERSKILAKVRAELARRMAERGIQF